MARWRPLVLRLQPPVTFTSFLPGNISLAVLPAGSVNVSKDAHYLAVLRPTISEALHHACALDSVTVCLWLHGGDGLGAYPEARMHGRFALKAPSERNREVVTCTCLLHVPGTSVGERSLQLRVSISPGGAHLLHLLHLPYLLYLLYLRYLLYLLLPPTDSIMLRKSPHFNGNAPQISGLHFEVPGTPSTLV